MRSNITVDILEMTANGLQNIGTWINNIEDPAFRLKFDRKEVAPRKKQLEDDDSLKNVTLNIITLLVMLLFILRVHI